MIWLSALAVVVGFVIWFLYSPPKPARTVLASPAAVAGAVGSVRNLGIEGGEVRIQVKNNPNQSVTLRKHIHWPSDIDLVGAVEASSLSPDRLDAVRSRLAALGIECSESVSDGHPELRARFDENWKKAADFLNTAIDVGFGADVGRDCVAYYSNVLIWNIPNATGVPNPS